MAAQGLHTLKSTRKQRASARDEVRAGPGDAGRQSRPETLPERPGDREKGRQGIRLLAILCAIGAVVYLILQLVR